MLRVISPIIVMLFERHLKNSISWCSHHGPLMGHAILEETGADVLRRHSVPS